MFMDYPIKTSKSGISGTGVFATRDIKIGEIICFMEGKEVSLLEAGRLEIEGLENAGDLLQIDDEKYIDMDERYRCINHSCNPNAFIRGKNELVALKDIKKEEEITYDYSATMWEDAEKVKSIFHETLWVMRCFCGSKNCRKIVKQFYELPQEIQENYFKSKKLQSYILKKLPLISTTLVIK